MDSKELTTEEIADLVQSYDSTPAVDALAELVRRYPRSDAAAVLRYVVHECQTTDPEQYVSMLASDLRVGCAPTAQELYQKCWMSYHDLPEYCAILSELTLGQDNLSPSDFLPTE